MYANIKNYKEGHQKMYMCMYMPEVWATFADWSVHRQREIEY